MPATLAKPGLIFAALLPLFVAALATTHAQSTTSDPRAIAILRSAIAVQMDADRNDHSNWAYRDHDTTPERDATFNVLETPQGDLKRLILLGTRALTPAEDQAETDRIRRYVHDPAEQARQRRNSAHDDAQASSLFQNFPVSFLWSVTADAPDAITLSFRPNPEYKGPDIAARVMATMAGQMVITHQGNHIRSFHGALTEDFKIGFGILAKLDKGGGFDVERRDVGQGLWEITENHVHIVGHALFFKTIGEQEDEVKTDWRTSPAKTLVDAARVLGINP